MIAVTKQEKENYLDSPTNNNVKAKWKDKSQCLIKQKHNQDY